jgi:hypothetical protein
MGTSPLAHFIFNVTYMHSLMCTGRRRSVALGSSSSRSPPRRWRLRRCSSTVTQTPSCTAANPSLVWRTTHACFPSVGVVDVCQTNDASELGLFFFWGGGGCAWMLAARFEYWFFPFGRLRINLVFIVKGIPLGQSWLNRGMFRFVHSGPSAAARGSVPEDGRRAAGVWAGEG